MLTQMCSVAGGGSHVVRIRNALTPLCLSHRESSVHWCFPPQWKGLLAWRPGLRVVSGSTEVLPLSSLSLVKLQFFIDQAGDPEPVRCPVECLAALSEGGADIQTSAELEVWYLSAGLHGAIGYSGLANYLRHCESYQLLGFLFKEGSSSEKLQHLAERYGVSISHFRRLCHQALGNAAKPELRSWRAAKALLKMSEGKCSLTDVALEFGFASSSHFSKEVRELVGVAPSSLIDITRLSSE